MCGVLEYSDTDLLLGVGLKLEALLIAGTGVGLAIGGVLLDLETRLDDYINVLIGGIRRNAPSKHKHNT